MERLLLQLVLRSKSNQKCKYDSPVYAGEFFTLCICRRSVLSCYRNGNTETVVPGEDMGYTFSMESQTDSRALCKHRDGLPWKREDFI